MIKNNNDKNVILFWNEFCKNLANIEKEYANNKAIILNRLLDKIGITNWEIHRNDNYVVTISPNKSNSKIDIDSILNLKPDIPGWVFSRFKQAKHWNLELKANVIRINFHDWKFRYNQENNSIIFFCDIDQFLSINKYKIAVILLDSEIGEENRIKFINEIYFFENDSIYAGEKFDVEHGALADAIGIEVQRF